MRVEHFGDATLYLGDCLEVLADMPENSVDAVVTDPPYMINTKSDGAGKISPWADWCNASFWYREWLGTCRNKIGGCGPLWSFLNWRSIVTFQKAACDLDWPIESLMVWDKQWIGPGGPNGLRPSYEMVALWCVGGFAIKNRGLPDVQRFKVPGPKKENGHPAEKPIGIIRFIVENSPGTILDPFMGSGTTGVACMNLGRKFIGIEIEEKYFSIACRRIDLAARQEKLALNF